MAYPEQRTRIDMNTAPGFLAVTVGEKSPFSWLPADQLTVSMSLAHVAPVIIVSLPEVTDEDIKNIDAVPQAVALRRSAALPSGALLLVLKVSDDQVWSICVPFLDEAERMHIWAGMPSKGNAALVVLVDAGTRIIRAQRTVALPPRLLEMARQGMVHAVGIDELAAIGELNSLSDQQVWEQSTRWEIVDESDLFTMVAEAPVQQ